MPRRPDPRLAFWTLWLAIVALGVLASGLALVLFPDAAHGFLNRFFLQAGHGRPPMDPEALRTVKFVCAVLGSVMAGWAAALLCVILGPFRRGRREGWRLLAISLAVWFLPDTAASLHSGFWQNALLNAGIAVALLVPLVATHGRFQAMAGLDAPEGAPRPDGAGS